MPAKVGDIEIYGGDTKDWPNYTFQNALNQPRDLVAEGWTDWTAHWRKKSDAVEFIDLVVNDSLANQGTLTIQATAEQTAQMEGPGVWDLQAKQGGRVKTWVVGKTKYTKDVTRVD